MHTPHPIRNHPYAAYAVIAVLAVALTAATLWQDRAAAAADALHITDPEAQLLDA